MSDVAPVRTPAPAKVALALKAAGWKEVDAAPWLWCRGGEAVSWEEAVGMSVGQEENHHPSLLTQGGFVVNAIMKILTSKEAMTVYPVLGGVMLDLIPLVTPWATGLPGMTGTIVGTALGTLSRSLSTKIKQKV